MGFRQMDATAWNLIKEILLVSYGRTKWVLNCLFSLFDPIIRNELKKLYNSNQFYHLGYQIKFFKFIEMSECSCAVNLLFGSTEEYQTVYLSHSLRNIKIFSMMSIMYFIFSFASIDIENMKQIESIMNNSVHDYYTLFWNYIMFALLASFDETFKPFK